MVPFLKDTSDPIEDVFQMHTNDVIESNCSYIDTEPLDIYCQQELCNEDLQDTVYGTNENFNTLFYDIDNDYDDDYDNYDIDAYDDTDIEAS